MLAKIDGVRRERTHIVMMIGAIIVVAHGIGVLANAYSLVVGDPRYSAPLWFTFMILKLVGLAAGAMLMRRQRAGFLVFAASLVAGMIVALGFTGPYATIEWLGAGAVSIALVLGGAFVAHRYWSELR